MIVFSLQNASWNEIRVHNVTLSPHTAATVYVIPVTNEEACARMNREDYVYPLNNYSILASMPAIQQHNIRLAPLPPNFDSPHDETVLMTRV
jgi:hypothetical protein